MTVRQTHHGNRHLSHAAFFRPTGSFTNVSVTQTAVYQDLLVQKHCRHNCPIADWKIILTQTFQVPFNRRTSKLPAITLNKPFYTLCYLYFVSKNPFFVYRTHLKERNKRYLKGIFTGFIGPLLTKRVGFFFSLNYLTELWNDYIYFLQLHVVSRDGKKIFVPEFDMNKIGILSEHLKNVWFHKRNLIEQKTTRQKQWSVYSFAEQGVHVTWVRGEDVGSLLFSQRRHGHLSFMRVYKTTFTRINCISRAVRLSTGGLRKAWPYAATRCLVRFRLTPISPTP